MIITKEEHCAIEIIEETERMLDRWQLLAAITNVRSVDETLDQATPMVREFLEQACEAFDDLWCTRRRLSE